jgi:phosphatidylserine/phosphatidylglycerophosphate/cardiolipin synthase-like enzyme
MSSRLRWWVWPVLLALLALPAACGSGSPLLDVGSSLPAPADRTPLPTVAPVVPTPAPVVPTPQVSPPAPPVAPTPGGGSAPAPTRPAPTLVAPALPTAAGHLPRDIGYDGGTWAVLFSPGARGHQANGQFIIDKLIATIDAAQSSIDLAVFETNLTPVAEALIRAHERGVVVRWITDDENGRDADGEEGRGQFARLAAAGIEVRDDLRSAFMHNKFILIDGQLLWTGSMNLTTNDVFRNNNNVVVLQSPAAVAVYAREFEEMWNGQFGPRSPSNVNGQTVMTAAGLPITIRFAPEDEPFDSLIQLVSLANESIRFMAFSFTEDELGEMMRRRAAEGVVVQGIFEVRGSETQYSEMPAMFCAGLEVRQDGNPGTFHHKVVIIDDFVVITGSMNFSDNAADSNDENVIAIADPAIGRLYREEFVRRWGEATLPDIECEE